MAAAARVFFACLALALLAACGSEPRLSRLSAHDTILAFGDSLTHGTGAGADESYPAQLARMIGRPVIASGVPGETTAAGLVRLPSVLATHRPRLVLLCLGGNDFLRRLPEAETEANLMLLVRTIRDSGAEVVLIALPEPKLFGGVAPVYKRVADTLRVPLETQAFVTVLKDSRLKADPVHANAEGYRVVAETLAAFLRERGAL